MYKEKYRRMTEGEHFPHLLFFLFSNLIVLRIISSLRMCWVLVPTQDKILLPL